MSKLKKGLALVLTLCMMLSLLPVITPSAEATGETENSTFSRIFHLDCGRKYFSVDQIKTLIDTLAENNYTHMELAIGNDGLRFLLDDMSVTANDTTYASDDVKAGIQAGNQAYYNAGTYNELTQAEMDTIISYANENGIGIIPLINTPGHMDAILDCMESVGISNPAYSTSARTVDVTNTAAVNFTLALVNKYIQYFAGKGCTYFNMGCDEYANDVSNSGFAGLISGGKYGDFVTYVNKMAAQVKAAGMTPMAFNDGIYYNNHTDSGTFDTDIVIAYWTSGWGDYSPASASFLAKKGHEIISTNDAWYYVLGRAAGNSSGYTIATAQNGVKNTACTDIPGSNDPTAVGCMICLWCDTPSASYSSKEVSNVTGLLQSFAENNPTYFTAPAVEETTLTDKGVSVTAPGLTSVTAKKADTSTPYTDYTASVTYSITLNNGAYTDSAKVRIPYDSVFDGCTEFIGNVDNETFPVQRDGDYFVATVPHFSYVTISGRAAAAPDGTEPRTITVTVGQTKLDTIEGANYSNNIDETELDKNIATVSAEYKPVAGGPQEVKATSITSGSSYYIKNSSGQYLSSSASWVSDISSAALWTATSNGNGYILKSGESYILHTLLGFETTNRSNWASTLTFKDGAFAYSGYLGTYTLGDAYTVTTTAPVDATTVTFTGVAVGTTYVTVGNTRYTINVVAEDLSKVTGINAYYWITSHQITADGATSKTIRATDSNVYSEQGAELTNLIPASGTDTTNAGVEHKYWKAMLQGGTRGGIQTGTSTDDKTSVGVEVTHIRYWDHQWQFKGTDGIWHDQATGDQITAYYLMKSPLTEEFDSLVKDWGFQFKDGQKTWTDFNSKSYAALSAQVIYEDATMNPANDSALVDTTFFFNYWNDRRGKRDIGFFMPQTNADFEIYKITTMHGTCTVDFYSTSQTAGSASVSYGNPLPNDAKEVTVWQESDGGTPVVVGDQNKNELRWNNNKDAVLIRIYVRTKVTEDSLKVHYVDQATGEEFYNYNIAVVKGTAFDPGFGLGKEPNTLINNTVTNIKEVEQTVIADLGKMTEIGALYRNRDYQCVQVARSDDGKEVYLYYIFNDVHSFVVDFGLPLEIDLNKDAGLSGEWTLSGDNGGAKYGTASISNGTLTYTPTQVLKGTEVLTLTTSDANETQTNQIYIYPATTVYYEEGFASYSNGWTDKGSKGTDTQTASVAGSKDNYGYDIKYANENPGRSNDTEATSGENGAGDKAIFAFTGTGVDIYANCAPNTGAVMIKVKQGATTVKAVQVLTALKNGTTDATQNQNKIGYNVPIASITGLEHGSYTVEIIHIKTKNDTGDTIAEVKLDGFRVYGTMNNDALHQEGGVYYLDKEDNPTFIELRDQVLASLNAVANDGTVASNNPLYIKQIAKNTLSQIYSTAGATNGKTNGVAIIACPGTYTNDNLKDLLDNGPKNEIYLQPGQALTFKITGENASRVVQVGLKALNASANCTINGTSKTISTSTDMFYTVLNKAANVTDQTVTITNNSGGILAVTKLKICDDPNATLGTLTAEDLIPALVSLGFETTSNESGGSSGGGGGGSSTPAEPTEPTTPPTGTGLPFTDVTTGDWFLDNVKYVYEKGLMNGTSDTAFSPKQTTNRAMIVTILHRLENSPAVDAQSPFADVAADQYYANPVAWAAANGIVTGTSDTTFAPLNNITREQMAAILYRYAQFKGYDVSVGEDTNILSYADAETISEYAVPAMQWAVGSGLINGKGGGVLDPQGSATRAEVSAILARFCEAYAK